MALASLLPSFRLSAFLSFHLSICLSIKVRQQLVDDHFLFMSGDKNLITAGMERDWPEGRGIFHNKVNENTASPQRFAGLMKCGVFHNKVIKNTRHHYFTFVNISDLYLEVGKNMWHPLGVSENMWHPPQAA